MWEFVVPITLAVLTPRSLLPPSIYGLITHVTIFALSSYLGKLIDKYDRLEVVRYGIAVQATCIAIASALLWHLLNIPEKEIDGNIFANFYSTCLFVTLLVTSAVELLGTTIVDLSVERDWIPELYVEEELSIMNSRMRGIDLAMEIVGPLVVGGLMSFSSMTAEVGFIYIAAFNFLSFFPQFLLLVTVYTNHTFALAKSPVIKSDIMTETSSSTSFSVDDWNPMMVMKESWSLFIRQPVSLVVVSWSMLWMTVLSPHGIVLTSYLKGQGVIDWHLSLFRGMGAISGLLGTLSFPSLSQRIGLKTTSQLCIAEEGLMLLLAAVTFSLAYFDIASSVMLQIFMLLVIISRFGLYAFGIGELTLLQQGIPEEVRGRVNSIETMLCNLATVTVYSGAALVSHSDNFIWLVWTSVISINSAAMIFFYWNSQWEIKEEEHVHGDDDELDGHVSCHNKQQRSSIDSSSKIVSPARHRHVYLVKRKPTPNSIN